MQQSVRVNPVGGINSDVDPLYLNNGDYADAKNIRSITTAGSTTHAVEPIQGTTLSVTLPVIVQQNKKYKLEIDVNKPYETTLLITDTDGSTVSNLSYTFDSGNTIAQFKTEIKDALDLELPGGYTFTGHSDSTNIMYIEILGNEDFVITGNDYITVTQIQESLTGVDQTGMLQPIASYDMDGDLYILSTVSDSETGGYGEIGVQVYDASADTFTYTRLLGSKEFLWSTQYPITKPAGERTDLKDALYFTDGRNPMRVFYYSGAYEQNGALTFNNPDGIYAYGSVANELRLIQTIQNTTITVGDQIQSGGSLTAGNWRYTVRLLTEQLASTAVLPISNPIPVFSESTTGDVLEIKGDVSGTVTGKINQVTVSNIDNELFYYIELIGVNYTNATQVAYKISRTRITGTEMRLQHTGNENGIEDFDINLLALDSDVVDKAEHLTIIDNRLVAANLGIAELPDFQTIADGITLTTKIYDLEGIGNVNQPGLAGGTSHSHNFVLGEYQNPANVVQYVGYQHYEKYFAGIRFQMNDGSWTQTYAIGEVQITPTSFNLTDNNYNHTVKVAYIEANNIDITSVSDQILGFSIVIADLIPEVLATGIVLMGWKPTTEMLPYPGFIASSGSYDSELTKNRKYGLFYSPDILNGNTSISHQVGDKFLVLGSPLRPTSAYEFGGAGGSTLAEFSGYFAATPAIGSHTILEASTVTFGNDVSIAAETFSLSSGANNFQGGIAFNTSTDIVNPTGNTYDDHGMYYCMYYRPLTDKYNSPESLNYNHTGHYYSVQAGDTVIDEQAVFGGDTFTQSYYLHVGYNLAFAANAASAIRFFSQNKGNMQMRHYSGEVGWLFPAETDGANINAKIGNWIDDTTTEYLGYNQGYNARNDAQILTAYDANLERVTHMGSRIIYSPLKPTNSTKDFYRTFLPLDFKDEELKDGEITGLIVHNGELFTMQPRAFRKQFFNTRGLVSSEDGTDILIGDGDVLAQKSQKVTSYGCKHRFGWVQGKSPGGNDTLYWINTENGKMLRFGGDGTVALSDVQGLQSFLANNTKWADLYDNPLYDGGICGVWDNRYGEAIFTFRAKRNFETWSALEGYYAAGTYVTHGTTGNFEGTGDIYKAKVEVLNANPPSSNPDQWLYIEHTDTDFYNEYTICFNEFKNKFTSFYTPKPRLYMQWRNTYFSSHPKAAYRNQIFLHNSGDELKWYGNGTVEQTDTGYIEVIANKDPNVAKTWYNLFINCEVTPYRIEVFTKNHESFLVEADFTNREEQFVSWIKNDILTSTDEASNDEVTSRIWGQYLKVRFYFETGEYNKLFNLIAGYRNNHRTHI